MAAAKTFQITMIQLLPRSEGGAALKETARDRAFETRRATVEDIPTILRLVGNEAKKTGMVLELSWEELLKWVERGHSLVATVNGKIVGHLAVNVWSTSKWTEIRSTVVDDEYRGKGIYTSLLAEMVKIIFEDGLASNVVILKDRATRGSGVLESIGFDEKQMASVPEELFSIGGDRDWKIYVAKWAGLRVETLHLKNLERETQHAE